MPHIFPKFRHLVVLGEKRFPVKITGETFMAFETPIGRFMKHSGRMEEDVSIKFEGPFSADGCAEFRP